MQDVSVDELGRALQQLLLASYGMYAEDLERELARASRHLGGANVVLLLADFDQRVLRRFDAGDERTVPIDAPGAGLAFRREIAVTERLEAGLQRSWLPVRDSSDRLGVFGVVHDGSFPASHWDAIASLAGELLGSKAAFGDYITLRRRRVPFSLAAEMRWSLLPPLTFTAPDVTIAGFVQPSHGVAGDAFDYSVTGRTASLAVFDAMGHGIEASRMANVTVGCYRHARRIAADPVATLVAIDAVIAGQFGDSRFVTAQAAAFDLDTGRLTIANAGHPPPLLLRAGRRASVIECPAARPAGLGTTPSSIVLQLEPGDAVLFSTDGITEARAPDGRFFGEERLATTVAGLVDDGERPAEILRRAVHAIVDHQGGRNGDDATLLMLRWSADARTSTEG